MGNEVSGRRSDDEYSDDDTLTDNGKRSRRSRKKNKNDDDNAAAYLIDTVCSNFNFYNDFRDKKRRNSFGSFSDDEDDDESLRDRRDRKSIDDSFNDEYSFEDKKKSGRGRTRSRRNDDDTTLDGEDETQEESVVKDDDRGSLASASDVPSLLSKPLASSFAKKCYFTKAGIGKKTQHYEGLTLTGNVVLMLSSAMQLKGCPTICDEDLRRVEQTYPNQFSRLPDELLLSSGWRRISKFCHFSNKPIPDGTPFFHSKERIHPQGGYYFLLASAVGMIRPIDVEPINRDTLVVLETDFAAQCDAAPPQLIHDPDQWTLVEKFCFFSGGPINIEEDVYYIADFEGNHIFMLAFLSPSLTPEELYRIGPDGRISEEHGLKSVAAVEEVESVYDLTERDFDDLKLYHLGPCRALPPYILMPQGWTKVLPPHFMKARQIALDFAREHEMSHATNGMVNNMQYGDMQHPSMNPHINDPYHQNSQWQQPPLQDQYYNRNHMYNNAQMQDGNYYAGQGYAQNAMNNPDLAYPPNQQPHMPPHGNQPAYYNPAAHPAPGGYIAPNIGDDATRLAQEEGAFGVTTGAMPMNEALVNNANTMGQQPPPQYNLQKEMIQSSTPNNETSPNEPAPSTPPPKPDLQIKTDFAEDMDEPGQIVPKSGQDSVAERSKESQHSSHSLAKDNASSAHDKQDEEEQEKAAKEYEDRFEVDENRLSPRRRASVEEKDTYGDSPSSKMSYNRKSPSVESLSRTSPSRRGFREYDANEYNDKNDEYIDEYGSHRSSPILEKEHLDGDNRYEDEFEVPDDEPDPSVDGLSSVGEYASPKASSNQLSQTGDNISSGFKSMRSPVGSGLSDYTQSHASQASYAMRGAQRILKQNRLKRMQGKNGPPRSGINVSHSKESVGDYDSSSEIGSTVSNSSVWTDTSMADRTSRRALILQMAKLRMKSGKSSGSTASKATSPNDVGSMKSDEDDPVENEAGSGDELDFNQELD